MYDPVFVTSNAPQPAYSSKANLYRDQAKFEHTAISNISGAHRYKFFKRPIVPFLHSLPPEVLLAPVIDDHDKKVNPLEPPLLKEDELRKQLSKKQARLDSTVSLDPADRSELEDEIINIKMQLDGKKCVEVQTVYRESEAQTDPYTPDYIIPVGATQEPEVLTLSSLTHKQGLPASQAEVEMIERARQKRDFEMSLPPITDEASFELRKNMMKQQEMREWNQREAEIDSLQAERLQLLQTAIVERDAENEFLSEQRVEALRQAKMEEKDGKIAAIQQARIKALRKMSRARNETAKQHNIASGLVKPKRDIIGEYADMGSRVYAPVRREGTFPDKPEMATRFEVPRSELLGTLRGLQELEMTMPNALTQTSVQKPRKKGGGGAHNPKERGEQQIALHLTRMDTLIKTSHLAMTGHLPEKQILMPSWRRAREKVQRPDTPSVRNNNQAAGGKAALSEHETQCNNALVLLQKLLRGRAVQNMMYEGKEKRRELIQELREATDLLTSREPELVDKDDVERDRAERAARVLDSAVDSIQGEVASSMFDFFSKELVRMQEHQRVYRLSRVAGETRRIREAEEGGRRQAEEVFRAREEEVFEQVVRVHQGSAQTFISELIKESVAASAHTMALKQLSASGTAYNSLLMDGGGSQNEAVMTELSVALMYPEVQRAREQQRTYQMEQRFTNAVEKSLQQIFVEAEQLTLM